MEETPVIEMDAPSATVIRPVDAEVLTSSSLREEAERIELFPRMKMRGRVNSMGFVGLILNLSNVSEPDERVMRV
jgi:hypothetical protein